MDLVIVGICLWGLITFLAFQAIVFRLIHSFKTLQLLFIMGSVVVVGGGGATWLMLQESIGMRGVATVVTMAILGIAVLIYILSIYSYLESSITTKMFMIIAHVSPVSQADFDRLYNPRLILQRRLQRFMAFTLVRQRHNRYELVAKQSVFGLRQYLGKAIVWMFPLHV